MRRLRRTDPLRALVRETSLEPGDLIYPLFICPGEGVRNPISSMPGVFNLSVDEAVREAEEAAALGIGGLAAVRPARIERRAGNRRMGRRRHRAAGAARAQESRARQRSWCSSPMSACASTPATATAASCQSRRRMCEVDNDPTLELLARTGVSQARAGADIVAPSDMMDGRVAAIREALDEDGN